MADKKKEEQNYKEEVFIAADKVKTTVVRVKEVLDTYSNLSLFLTCRNKRKKRKCFLLSPTSTNRLGSELISRPRYEPAGSGLNPSLQNSQLPFHSCVHPSCRDGR